MIIFFIAFCLLILFNIGVSLRKPNKDFLSKEKTDSIKGVFILIVFLSHISEYFATAGADLSAWHNRLLFLIPKAFGQLMVVMFLFYSGYGVRESIKKKGSEYISRIPRKRVLNTLLNFDIAVVFFTIIGLLIGNDISISRFCLSLTAWDSVGNSNWYIFVILLCYILTFLNFRFLKSGGGILCILLAISAGILSMYKGTWWYNTILAYGIGVLFSEYKDKILKTWETRYYRNLAQITGIFISVLILYLYWYEPLKGEYEKLGALVFNFMSMAFALTVVMVSMRISVDNTVLRWLGKNLFPFYIYQRLPMIVFSYILGNEIIIAYPTLFFCLCLAVTIAICFGYKYIRVSY